MVQVQYINRSPLGPVYVDNHINQYFYRIYIYIYIYICTVIHNCTCIFSIFSLYILLIPLSAPVGGYCSLPGNCICLPGFSADNCTEIEGETVYTVHCRS